MKKFLHDYSLGVAYVFGWILCWALHYVGLYMHVEVHHENNLFWRWFSESLENLASEYHQVGAFIILAKYLRFRGSPQSRCEGDRLEAKVDEIRRLLGLQKTDG